MPPKRLNFPAKRSVKIPLNVFREFYNSVVGTLIGELLSRMTEEEFSLNVKAKIDGSLDALCSKVKGINKKEFNPNKFRIKRSPAGSQVSDSFIGAISGGQEDLNTDGGCNRTQDCQEDMETSDNEDAINDANDEPPAAARRDTEEEQKEKLDAIFEECLNSFKLDQVQNFDRNITFNNLEDCVSYMKQMIQHRDRTDNENYYHMGVCLQEVKQFCKQHKGVAFNFDNYCRNNILNDNHLSLSTLNSYIRFSKLCDKVESFKRSNLPFRFINTYMKLINQLIPRFQKYEEEKKLIH